MTVRQSNPIISRRTIPKPRVLAQVLLLLAALCIGVRQIEAHKIRHKDLIEPDAIDEVINDVDLQSSGKVAGGNEFTQHVLKEVSKENKEEAKQSVEHISIEESGMD